MTTTEQESILEKVRKLLAQAEHQNTSAVEAEVFTAKATALMAKYAIDSALLGNVGSTGPREAIHKHIPLRAPYADEKSRLLMAVARFYDVHLIWVDSKIRNGVKRVNAFGMPESIEAMEMTYTSLELQLVRSMPGKSTHDGLDLWAARASYINGFNAKVSERLKEQKAAARAAAAQEHGESSVALALRSDADRVEDLFRQVTGHAPRYGRSRSTTYDSSAYAAGQRAGASADLGGRRVSSGTKGALNR